jgi:hypothetical protein
VLNTVLFWKFSHGIKNVYHVLIFYSETISRSFIAHKYVFEAKDNLYYTPRMHLLVWLMSTRRQDVTLVISCYFVLAGVLFSRHIQLLCMAYTVPNIFMYQVYTISIPQRLMMKPAVLPLR